MTSVDSTGGFENNLLKNAANTNQKALEAHLEQVILPLGYRCTSSNQEIENVYFPTHGIIGRTARGQSEARIDAGIYGRDGFSGIPLVYGLNRSPHDDIVQVAGQAARAPAGIIMELLRRDAAFCGLLLRFTHCLALQASFSALSSMSDGIRKRLCRLLVMCLDRTDGHELKLTHSSLATTLGVRRASVTSAIHHLEGDRLIRATRGTIQIKDRESLRMIAGTSYGFAEREYSTLIGKRIQR